MKISTVVAVASAALCVSACSKNKPEAWPESWNKYCASVKQSRDAAAKSLDDVGPALEASVVTAAGIEQPLLDPMDAGFAPDAGSRMAAGTRLDAGSRGDAGMAMSMMDGGGQYIAPATYTEAQLGACREVATRVGEVRAQLTQVETVSNILVQGYQAVHKDAKEMPPAFKPSEDLLTGLNNVAVNCSQDLTANKEELTKVAEAVTKELEAASKACEDFAQRSASAK